jgi:hypothetical protein
MKKIPIQTEDPPLTEHRLIKNSVSPVFMSIFLASIQKQRINIKSSSLLHFLSPNCINFSTLTTQ